MNNYIVNIVKEGRFFVARCPTLDVTSQGRTMEQARENIREAIEAYLKAFGKEIRAENRIASQEAYWTSVAV